MRNRGWEIKEGGKYTMNTLDQYWALLFLVPITIMTIVASTLFLYIHVALHYCKIKTFLIIAKFN